MMSEQSLIEQFNGLDEADKARFIESSIDKHPDFIGLKLAFAKWYLSVENWENARVIFNQHLEDRRFIFHSAILEIKSNNIAVAEKHTATLFDANPEDFQVFALRGRIALAKGSKDCAIKYFEAAIKIDVRTVVSIVKLVDLYIEKNNFEAAELVLKKGLGHDPDNFFLLMKKGKLAQAQNDFKSSISNYQLAELKAVDKNLASTAVMHRLLVQEKFSNLKDVIDQLNQSIKKYPDHIGLNLRLVIRLVKDYQHENALLLIENIIRKNPGHIMSLQVKANVLFHIGNFKQAEATLDRILSLAPNSLTALNLKGKIYERQENKELAFQTFQKTLKLHPDNETPYVSMAQFLYSQGRTKHAFKLLGNALKSLPNSKAIVEKSIQLNMHIGNYEYALVLIEQQLKEAPKNEMGLWYKAIILQKSGDFDEAINTANFLKNIDHIDQLWVNRSNKILADIAFLNYDYEKAEAIFTDLVKVIKIPNFERNRLALLLLLKGDLTGAVQQLEIATKEIEKNHNNGMVIIPLNGHISRIINEFRIDPILFKQLKESLELQGAQRIKSIAKILLNQSSYFGAALYLGNELRAQGILDKISNTIPQQKESSQIPKTIVQYWDEEKPPLEVVNIMSTWRRLNPTFEHLVFSRNTAYFFIKKHYGDVEAEAFVNCKHPAMQADFFRLAYLSKMGGFYADADDKCRQSLDILLDRKAELIVKLGDFGCFANNFLACTPNNSLLTYALKEGTKNMNSYFNESPWFRLGPGHLTTCLNYQLAKYVGENDFTKWPKILTLSQSEARKIFCLHLTLAYKRTDKSWFTAAYAKQISTLKANKT